MRRPFPSLRNSPRRRHPAPDPRVSTQSGGCGRLGRRPLVLSAACSPARRFARPAHPARRASIFCCSLGGVAITAYSKRENEAVASCIRTVVRTWVFPFKPKSDVPVAYPFVFSPAS